MSHPVERFRKRRESIRSELGGAERVEALRGAGRRNVRERLAAFVDSGSFEELGTFARSGNPADADSTPGDGKVGGHATVDGRPVTVAGDDITVKRASSSQVGSRKLLRLYEQALRMGQPFVYFGETGGARIPDTLGAEGFVQVPPLPALALRQRRIPMATAIVGESFGGSSFLSALSDFVVQVRGSCLAVTSPRVIEVATGERIDMEALGGVDVHARVTGQVDVTVDTEDAAFAVIRQFLSYLPSNAWTPPPRGPAADALEPDEQLLSLVPERRRRAYDMRAVLRRLVDGGTFLELRPHLGRGLLTVLARMDGGPVGIIASQPLYLAGSLDPDACDKATRLLCLCDAFGLPVIFLQDTPGFLVGTRVEHSRLLYKAMLFQQALSLARVPRLTVVLRKAFGLAFFSLGGSDMGSDLLCAWPGAEIGFMDPEVAANVLFGPRLEGLGPEQRREQLQQLAGQISANTEPYGAAGILKLDEIIDPVDTRGVLVRHLRRLAGTPFRPGHERPLASWPTCW
ncbi:acyl-CoA carboxylase subunit beta [Archangium sp.]|uniref:acyl-CoA carboxylase subunit beta n=1 Tax=Archangium sp. TaxID=1872627 RepID=UPI002D47BA27|nr:carboxyl transferase domain-containing protein [Archangium sp.]HYO54143.1 carboxyl transferase domain-containing protein [Archangium sp.]